MQVKTSTSGSGSSSNSAPLVVGPALTDSSLLSMRSSGSTEKAGGFFMGFYNIRNLCQVKVTVLCSSLSFSTFRILNLSNSVCNASSSFSWFIRKTELLRAPELSSSASFCRSAALVHNEARYLSGFSLFKL